MSILKVDSKNLPPQGSMEYSMGCCKPCGDAPCDDVQEGEFKFTGPNKIHMKCEPNAMNSVVNPILEAGTRGAYMFPRSYQILQDLGDGCYAPFNAVSADTPAQICCEGDFVIKYKWDNCLFDEPVFVESDPCCTCC